MIAGSLDEQQELTRDASCLLRAECQSGVAAGRGYHRGGRLPEP
jgi:hypothetical protein